MLARPGIPAVPRSWPHGRVARVSVGGGWASPPWGRWWEEAASELRDAGTSGSWDNARMAARGAASAFTSDKETQVADMEDPRGPRHQWGRGGARKWATLTPSSRGGQGRGLERGGGLRPRSRTPGLRVGHRGQRRGRPGQLRGRPLVEVAGAMAEAAASG